MLAKKSPRPSRRTEVAERSGYRCVPRTGMEERLWIVTTLTPALAFSRASIVPCHGPAVVDATPTAWLSNMLPSMSAKSRRLKAREAYTFLDVAVRQ